MVPDAELQTRSLSRRFRDAIQVSGRCTGRVTVLPTRGPRDRCAPENLGKVVDHRRGADTRVTGTSAMLEAPDIEIALGIRDCADFADQEVPRVFKPTVPVANAPTTAGGRGGAWTGRHMPTGRWGIASYPERRRRPLAGGRGVLIPSGSMSPRCRPRAAASSWRSRHLRVRRQRTRSRAMSQRR
jgi:hypothetical protein